MTTDKSSPSIMAKSSQQKRCKRYEKDHPGCMWGLLRIFDLHQRHPVRRLVADRRHAGGRHAAGVGYSKRPLNFLKDLDGKHKVKDPADCNLSVKSKVIKMDSSSATMKTLIAEEMSKEQHLREPKQMNLSTMGEPTRSYLGRGNHLERDHNETTLTCKVTCDLDFHNLESSVSLEPEWSSHPKYRERFRCDSNQTTPVGELCGQDLQEKLGEAMETFLNQKFNHETHFSGDGTFDQSDELMDALEILDSNKELFLKLLQDPNSLLVKHIEHLQSAQTEKLCKTSECRSLTPAESSEDFAKSRQSEEIINDKQLKKQNLHRLFRKREKLRGAIPSREGDNSENSTSIVVLKPHAASIQNTGTETGSSSLVQSQCSSRYKGESERVASHFSLKEIKRKLKQAIGESKKERERVTMDGVLDKIPYGHRESQEPKISISTSRRDSTGKSRKCQTSFKYEVSPTRVDNLEKLRVTPLNLEPRESAIISKEAKKHIAEVLGHKEEDLLGRQVPRTLETILALPEYKLMSPGSSPARDMALFLSSDQLRFFSQLENENMLHLKREKTVNYRSPLRDLESSASSDSMHGEEVAKLEGGVCIRGNSSPKVDIGTVEIANSMQTEKIEECDRFVAASEADERRLVLQNCVEERVSEATEPGCSFLDPDLKQDKIGCDLLGTDLFEEKPLEESPLGFFSPSALLIHGSETSESIIEKHERPSPVSVLEPFFLEDVISPASSTPHYAEFPTTPQRIHSETSASSPLVTSNFQTTYEHEMDQTICSQDKEDEFDYVSVVLEASSLSGNELVARWQSSKEPLDQSLFDEIGGFPDQFSSDQKLLFDCVNEVLMDICQQFSVYIRPKIQPVPVGKNLVWEVWAGVNCHLNPPPTSPRTLDQILERDMARTGRWMDLRFEAESLGVEMEESILEDLIEETILELQI